MLLGDVYLFEYARSSKTYSTAFALSTCPPPSESLRSHQNHLKFMLRLHLCSGIQNSINFINLTKSCTSLQT